VTDVIYTVTNDLDEAETIVKELWAQGDKAWVERVIRMRKPPRTSKKWAVVVERGG